MDEGIITLKELKNNLPKNITHNSLLKILKNLELKGNIYIGSKGISWIYLESKKLKEMIKEGTEI